MLGEFVDGDYPFKKNDIIYVKQYNKKNDLEVREVLLLTWPHVYDYNGEKMISFRGLTNKKENDFTVREKDVL